MLKCSFSQRDITDLKEITFSNIQSVHLYINSALDWGNFTIKFDNILEKNDFGYGREGSVVVYGEVSGILLDYFSCQKNYFVIRWSSATTPAMAQSERTATSVTPPPAWPWSSSAWRESCWTT